MALTLLASIMLSSATPFGPRPVSAAPVAVGLGSYNTTLPAGAKVPDNSGGTPVTPKRTGNVTGAMPTNDWWSSLGWQRYAGNPYSENMFAYPLALHAKASGLGVGYSTSPGVGTEYHYGPAEALTIGVAGLNSPDAKVDGYSDWTVTGYWSGGGSTLRTTFGHGLPFVYATKTGGNAQIVTNAAPTVFATSGANALGITVSGQHYGLFAPAGASWTQSGSTFSSTLAGKDYFSVAVLPDNTSATLNDFKAHAFAFVTNTVVSWSYNQTSALLNTTFTATTTAKEGTETRPLMALFRHQWLNSSSVNTSYTYVSARGQMKVVRGASFSTSMTFNGVLPSLPDKGTYNRTQLNTYINEIYNGGNVSVGAGLDTYNTGKQLYRLAALIPIAEQMGNTAAKNAFLNAVKTRLQDWFQAPDGKSADIFHYNSAWGTLIGYPASFGSETELNDHHFHYGYYILAAALVAQYDATWAQDSQWGGMVKLLIRDANSWNHSDGMFPFLRTFDPYEGHSWASGHAGFGAGNNHESSSEAMMFNTAVLLFGANVSDNTIRDLGIFLYTTEMNAIEQYWMDVDNAVFPSSFAPNAVGIVWGDGGAHATWFSAAPEMIHGINFLPITGGSLYLGRRPAYVTANYNEIVAENGGTENEWVDVIWEYQALANPGAAISKFGSGAYTPFDGETKAHTYHWLHNLNAMGQLDTTITANVPTYAVFNNAGARTYVAYNPGSAATTVTFSNGTTLSVPARSLAAGSGTPGGDTQAPSTPANLAVTAKTSTSVSLSWSASTDNVGVTGYEIFNGASLAATSTTTSATVSGLSPSTSYTFTVKARDAAGNRSAASSAVTTTTNAGATQSNTLYVIDGAATGVNGALSFSAGGGASTDTIASAGGTNHDGAPTNPLVYIISNISGTYDSTKTTGFSAYIDAGANVGDASQVRVSYDFTGDGSYDRIETYNYFATNDLSGFEQYAQTSGLKSSSGAFANLSNGRVKLEIWNAIGTHTVALRTSATAANGSQSHVTIPFINIQ
jgi:endoglucanase Acf2